MKKVFYFLQKWDAFWSVPFSFLLFYLVGLFLGWAFGYGAGSYDVAFIQPLFLASAIVIGATNAGIAGVFFTLRGIHNYVYGRKDVDGRIHNYSQKDWRQMPSSTRFITALMVLAYFISTIIIVYLKLV